MPSVTVISRVMGIGSLLYVRLRQNVAAAQSPSSGLPSSWDTAGVRHGPAALARCARGASSGGGVAPPGAKATGAWRQIRRGGVRQSRDVRQKPGRPPGRRAPSQEAARTCARGMLGPRAAPGNWPGGPPGPPRTRAAEAAGSRRQVGDRRSACRAECLAPGGWRGAGRLQRWGNDGSLVDRARTGLRHHHAADRGRSRRSCAAAQLQLPAVQHAAGCRCEQGESVVGGRRWSRGRFGSRLERQPQTELRNGEQGRSSAGAGRGCNRRGGLGLHGDSGRRPQLRGAFFAALAARPAA